MSITIYYLPLQAKGEIPRLILSYGKIPFENSVITFQEWGSTEKSSNEKHLFGQLPSAKLPSGKLLSQSGSISRYFAKLAHIYPR